MGPQGEHSNGEFSLPANGINSAFDTRKKGFKLVLQ